MAAFLFLLLLTKHHDYHESRVTTYYHSPFPLSPLLFLVIIDIIIFDLIIIIVKFIGFYIKHSLAFANIVEAKTPNRRQ